jgi:hypothetical protein
MRFYYLLDRAAGVQCWGHDCWGCESFAIVEVVADGELGEGGCGARGRVFGGMGVTCLA